MANTVAELSAVSPVALRIRQGMIPVGNRNRPGSKLYATGDLYGTQHTTGNPNDWATAESHRIFCDRDQGGQYSVSFHFVVDDIEAIQLLPLDEVGYHAGDGMDDYRGDIGGWGSVAMELCVNYADVPARWLKAKQNAVALWAAILTGDPRIAYGATDYRRFSADRIRPHRRWSDELKWCPTELLNEGNMDPWTGAGPFVDAVKVLAGGQHVPTESIYPDGMDHGIATMLFGRAVGDDGRIYEFYPKGVISTAWLEHGKITGEWPELVSVRRYDTRRYFVFSSGWTLWLTGDGPVMELK